ncbi:Plasmid stabilization system protein ParE [Dyadobacter soli]|uniref:Plasmid stabilization system protein ParE n=1 Tax=Dyadobacter soli TaxID=659014 RepID=A0A1G8ADN4_9BACT|nr:type II toxin-antitoxin system RelE/ParE family toxin [Dyadobacter soli]SDH18987.1 Plasmid stabilization system protein ParE [Dyadobacter soli]
MNMPVRWTAEAEKSFTDIIAHLETNWSEKEVRKFIRKTKDVLKQISVFPLMYEASRARPGVRKGFVTKQCTLFYKVKKDHIVLLSFWDNRRKPTSRN